MTHEKNMDLNEILKYCEDIKTKWCEVCMLSYIGEILLNIDNQHISEAENWIERSIEEDIRNGMMWNLAQDFALCTELFKRKNDLPKAREKLSKALEIFKECGDVGLVEKYAQLIQQNIDQANYLAERVKNALELELVVPVFLNIVCFRYIADGLSEEELKELNNQVLWQLWLSGSV